MRFLRSNTAVIVTVGPFYDKTDGVTIETALTITNERITLTADTDAGSAPTNILDNVTGATSGTSNDLNYITGNDAGMMQLELAAADVNRVGRMFLSITDAANHVPVFHEFFVLPQAIYDWLTGVIVPLPANVTQLLGTAWLTPGTAGTPDVNTKLAGGTAWGLGAITAGSIAGDAITAAKIADGAIDNATFAADTGLQTARSGTAQGGAATTITLDAGASAVDDFYKNHLVYITGGTGAKQARFITGYAGATKIATVTAWATNPDNTSTFALLPSDGVSAPTAAAVADAVWDELRADHTTAGTFGQGAASVQGNVTGSVASVTGAVGSVTGSVGSVTGAVGSVTGAVGSVTGAVGSVTGNVGGNVTGSVGSVGTGGISAASFAAGAIDAAAIAADAIGSSELAASAATEIANAVAALTMTEPTAPPAVNDTLIKAISWLLVLARNKVTQTATQQLIKADDGATTIGTSTLSDDGTTFTRGEFA